MVVWERARDYLGGGWTVGGGVGAGGGKGGVGRVTSQRLVVDYVESFVAAVDITVSVAVFVFILLGVFSAAFILCHS